MKWIKLFLLFVAFSATEVIVAQVSSDWTRDVTILGSFFETAPKAPVDSTMIRAALYFLNSPYESETLEGEDEEDLVVDLRTFDCVTFVESCLALSRANQYPYPDMDYFERELRLIRYRNGIVNGYTSRLHYMSDWIFDNAGKGIVEDVTHALGGQKLKMNVHFMSDNFRKYPQLSNSPDDVQRMQVIERQINSRGNYYYIPKIEIREKQSLIKSGDIICFTTSIPGLDTSHVGIAYWHKGQLTFIHASTIVTKVIVNPESLSDYCTKIKSNTGIIVLRPVNTSQQPEINAN